MDIRYDVCSILFTLGSDGQVDWVRSEATYETVDWFSGDEYLLVDSTRPRRYKLVLSATMVITRSRWWGLRTESLSILDAWKHPMFVALEKLLTNIALTGMINAMIGRRSDDQVRDQGNGIRHDIYKFVARQAARELELRAQVEDLPVPQDAAHLGDYLDAAQQLLQGLLAA